MQKRAAKGRIKELGPHRSGAGGGNPQAGGGNPQPAEDEILIMVSIMVSILALFSTASPARGGWIEPAEREATARPLFTGRQRGR